MSYEELKDIYVYKKFIGKKRRDGIKLIVFAVLLVLLVLMSHRLLSNLNVVAVILAAVSFTGGVIIIKKTATPPGEIFKGTITDIIKIDKNTGNEAHLGTKKFDGTKHMIDWRFMIDDGTGRTVMAQRTESWLSDTNDIKNTMLEKGTEVIVFLYNKKYYMILEPPREDKENTISYDTADDEDTEEYEGKITTQDDLYKER